MRAYLLLMKIRLSINDDDFKANHILASKIRSLNQILTKDEAVETELAETEIELNKIE